jgi:hypothetical protein
MWSLFAPDAMEAVAASMSAPPQLSAELKKEADVRDHNVGAAVL